MPGQHSHAEANEPCEQLPVLSELPHFGLGLFETVDLIGALMSKLAVFLSSEPSGMPGLLYTIGEDYFRRIEAVEYAVKNDDGAEPRNLPKADLVLVGISRTYKRDRRGVRHEVYAVSWNPRPGVARGTSFSIRKYGEDTAFKMACRLRWEKMREVYGDRYQVPSYLDLYRQKRSSTLGAV